MTSLDIVFFLFHIYPFPVFGVFLTLFFVKCLWNPYLLLECHPAAPDRVSWRRLQEVMLLLLQHSWQPELLHWHGPPCQELHLEEQEKRELQFSLSHSWMTIKLNSTVGMRFIWLLLINYSPFFCPVSRKEAPSRRTQCTSGSKLWSV